MIVLEALNTKGMARRPRPKPDPDRPGQFRPNGARAKAGLNRGIHRSLWGLLQRRLADGRQRCPAPPVDPAYSSQQCRSCGHTPRRTARAKRSSPASPVATATTPTATLRRTFWPPPRGGACRPPAGPGARGTRPRQSPTRCSGNFRSGRSDRPGISRFQPWEEVKCAIFSGCLIKLMDHPTVAHGEIV